jgi:hypothetical protein
MFKRDLKYYAKHPDKYITHIEKTWGIKLFDYQKEYVKTILELSVVYDVVRINYPRWFGKTFMYKIIDDMNRLNK